LENPNDRRSSFERSNVRGGAAERRTPFNRPTMSEPAERTALFRTALVRGWRKRCPHCGIGPLFAGRWRHLERCSQCGLVFERNPGDTWAFTVIGDRLPIAAIIAVIYFGLVRQHFLIGLTVIALLGILVVWTAPNRWGVGIALHYVSRVIWPDPEDPVPQQRA
jgi:uncharacterized protein (DUF983 family)